MKELTAENFSEETIEASKGGLVIVDFWAPWCGPCKAFLPVLEEVATELEGSVTITKLNVDDHSSVPASHGIRAVPTLQVYKDGKLLKQQSGSMTKQDLLELIDSCGE